MPKDKNKIYEEVHNYTEKQVVAHIDKHLDKKLKVNECYRTNS